MGIPNPKRLELLRLESKTLDGRFRQILEHEVDCSPVVARAVLGAVKEVYAPWLDETSRLLPPGRTGLVAVDAEEPAGKPIMECSKRVVSLTVHRGADDDALLQREGPTAFRRRRIPDLCQQALSQGGLLTREDLAYRIFFVSPRTISRDLACLRHAQPARPLPLRSTVRDIGPVLTHRVEIVRLALHGKTTTQIGRILHHSPEAIANYVGTFTRCAQLAERRLQASEIAFLLDRGPGLIRQYLELLEHCRRDPAMKYHLEQLLDIGQLGPARKTSRSRRRGRPN